MSERSEQENSFEIVISDGSSLKRAQFSLIQRNEYWDLLIESANSTRNTGYNAALTLILERLKGLEGILIDAVVEANDLVKRGLTPEERRIPLSFPVVLKNQIDCNELRIEIAREAKWVHAQGGNTQRRLRFKIHLPIEFKSEDLVLLLKGGGTGNALKLNLEKVMHLQKSYSKTPTPEMKERENIVEFNIPFEIAKVAPRIAEILEIPEKSLDISGSAAGSGNKPQIPWVRFADINKSPGPQEGIYCVFLFDRLGNATYLSLNSGSTEGRDNKPKRSEVIRKDVNASRKACEELILQRDDLMLEIELGATGRSRGNAYAKSNAVALKFEQSRVPDDRAIVKEILFFAKLLKAAYDSSSAIDVAEGNPITSEGRASLESNSIRSDQNITFDSAENLNTREVRDVFGSPYSWADEAPTISGSGEIKRDLEKAERGLKGHSITQNLIVEWVLEQGLTPRSPSSIDVKYDVAWYDHNNIFHVCEVKSLTPLNEEDQMRKGLGQVLRYRQKCGLGTVAVLAVERPPSDLSWVDLCVELGVRIVWPESFSQLEISFST